MPEATLHFLHPPEPDAAFLFFPIALRQIDFGEFEIETSILPLDAAFDDASRGAADLIALPVHACAHLIDRYEILSCGATLDPGPAIVGAACRTHFPKGGGEEQIRTWLSKKRVALPGTLSTASLLLGLFNDEIETCVIATGRIAEALEAGFTDAALIESHHGDGPGPDGPATLFHLGEWWSQKNGTAPPCSCCAVRSDLSPAVKDRIEAIVAASARFAIDHREAALSWAAKITGMTLSQLEAIITGRFAPPSGRPAGEAAGAIFKLIAQASARKLTPFEPRIRAGHIVAA